MTQTAKSSELTHTPVLLEEVLGFLTPRDGRVYVDATFGRGGYTRAILEAADCKVIAIDRDQAALDAGQALAQEYGDRLVLLHGAFSHLDQLLESQGISHVDGMVFDLGVSSPQLEEAERGFSFMKDGPLDMRMDRSSGQSAADLVNLAEEQDLAHIIKAYGEERQARRVAAKIVSQRQIAPIETTGQLAELVRSVVRMAPGSKIDPATRTFQALRIAVNEELEEIKKALGHAEERLASQGILVVVSFHSLEDRIVKVFLNEYSGRGDSGSRRLPGEAIPPAPTFELLSRKAVVASDQEANENPRARSAKLRAAKRTDAASWAQNNLEGGE